MAVTSKTRRTFRIRLAIIRDKKNWIVVIRKNKTKKKNERTNERANVRIIELRSTLIYKLIISDNSFAILKCVIPCDKHNESIHEIRANLISNGPSSIYLSARHCSRCKASGSISCLLYSIGRVIVLAIVLAILVFM